MSDEVKMAQTATDKSNNFVVTGTSTPVPVWLLAHGLIDAQGKITRNGRLVLHHLLRL